MPSDVVTVVKGNDEYRALIWRCPGCGEIHQCSVYGKKGWAWNGSTTRPTLAPSVLSTGAGTRCHLFVENGVVRFLADCEHDLRGQAIPMLPEHADPFAPTSDKPAGASS